MVMFLSSKITQRLFSSFFFQNTLKDRESDIHQVYRKISGQFCVHLLINVYKHGKFKSVLNYWQGIIE